MKHKRLDKNSFKKRLFDVDLELVIFVVVFIAFITFAFYLTDYLGIL